MLYQGTALLSHKKRISCEKKKQALDLFLPMFLSRRPHRGPHTVIQPIYDSDQKKNIPPRPPRQQLQKRLARHRYVHNCELAFPNPP